MSLGLLHIVLIITIALDCGNFKELHALTFLKFVLKSNKRGERSASNCFYGRILYVFVEVLIEMKNKGGTNGM